MCEITRLLNLPVDVGSKLKLSRNRRRRNKDLLRKETMAINTGQSPPLDGEVIADRLPLYVSFVALLFALCYDFFDSHCLLENHNAKNKKSAPQPPALNHPPLNRPLLNPLGS